MNKRSKRQTIQQASIIAACLVTLVMVAHGNIADRLEANMPDLRMIAEHNAAAESNRLAHDALARAKKAAQEAEQAAQKADKIAREAAASAQRAADSADRIARIKTNK